MNTPDLTTVAAGQIRDEIKRNIEEAMAHEQREVSRRMLIAEAASWLRVQAPGRALELLEAILSDYEKQDQAERAELLAFEQAGKLPCGCPVAMEALCPHKKERFTLSDLLLGLGMERKK